MQPAQSNDELISKEAAIALAEHDAGGFLGTWVDATAHQDAWHITAGSKSANPPVQYIIHRSSGEILAKFYNTDDPAQKELLADYLAGKLISKEQAVEAAGKTGFLGTWITAWVGQGGWHIFARSKSATPGQYYIVDARGGKVLLHKNGSGRLSRAEIDAYFQETDKN